MTTWQREKGRGASANWKNSTEDIWFAGDGAGTSRGITGAWASGIRAAEGIIESL